MFLWRLLNHKYNNAGPKIPFNTQFTCPFRRTQQYHEHLQEAVPYRHQQDLFIIPTRPDCNRTGVATRSAPSISMS